MFNFTAVNICSTMTPKFYSMERLMSKKLFETDSYTILFVLFIALVLRFIWSMIIPVAPVSDSVMYHEFAKVISDTGRYAFPEGNLTAYWPVGTPAIYGLLYSIFGQNYDVIVFANIFVGVLTTYFIFAIAQNWFGSKCAIISSLIYALWPSQIEFTTILASELLFNLFVLAGIYFWVTISTQKLASLILGGVFFTAAAYVRPIALLIPFILIFIVFLDKKNIKKTFLQLIVTIIVMASLIAPWAYRNFQVFGEPVLISTNGGPVLWMGNNPDSNGEYMPLPNIKFESEVERAKYFKAEAIQHIQAEPLLFLNRMAKRLVDYYRSENIGVAWNKNGLNQIGAEPFILPLKVFSSGYWMLILLLAVYGGWRLVKTEGLLKTFTATPIFALLGYFTVLHMIIASGDRYHFPIVPFLAMLASISVQKISQKKN
jgi:4-amino-4-deoxy-L-arabinose transferase-like glycosyltransferase